MAGPKPGIVERVHRQKAAAETAEHDEWAFTVVNFPLLSLREVATRVAQKKATGTAAVVLGQTMGQMQANEVLGQAVEIAERAATVSDRALDFIAGWEGMRLQLYNDAAGNATIGVGHLVHMGPIDGSEPANFKNGITRKQALNLLQKDAQEVVDAVTQQITVNLNQHQLDALVSFGFNVGTGEGGLKDSTLRKRINAGAPPKKIREAFEMWTLATVHGKKVELEGLVKRRAAEADMYISGDYSGRP